MTAPYAHLFGQSQPSPKKRDPYASLYGQPEYTGNVDLSTRPHVKNADGSVSTVRSMSFNEDGKEILVPTVSDDGRIMSNDEAVAQYHKTGKHLGIFPDVASADRAAQSIHEQQAQTLAPGGDIDLRTPEIHAPLDFNRAVAGRDASNTMRTPNTNPHPQHLPEPVASLMKYGVDPMMEHPLATTIMGASGPIGGALGLAGMVKDITEYGGQKAAELSLPDDVRRMAEADPSRISGKQAAVEAGLLASPSPMKAIQALDRNAAAAGIAEARAFAEHAQRTSRPTLTAARPTTPVSPLEYLRPDMMRDEPPTTTPSLPHVETMTETTLRGPQERNLGFALADKTRANIRNAYRSAIVTPYAEIEREAPDLANALLSAGASRSRAQHISQTRMGRVMAGLSDEQRSQFGTQLVHDNLIAEADRKGAAASAATDPAEAATLAQAAQNFADHATRLAPRLVAGIDQQPWFQRALTQYKTDIEGPLTKDAMASGVDPRSLRQPQSAYVRLASDARLDDAEIRRALDVAGVADPADLQQRPALLRKLIGENPALSRYFAQHAQGPRQGPLAANAGYGGDVPFVPPKRVGVTGSSKMAQGTAQDYATDLSRIVDFDARDKAVKASKNQIWQEVAKTGRQLDAGEAPGIGKTVVAFDDAKGLVTGDQGSIRFEVSPTVRAAIEKYVRGMEPRSTSGFQKLSDLATRAQIAGMPVEATSHALRETALAAAVPGEKDMVGKLLATIPGVGSKAATVREMLTMDLKDPDIQSLENRLADIGALRVEDHRSGLVNQSHNFLFGERGIDKRARLVLARKLLQRKPDASDAALREFINSQVGNYNAQNAGSLPNTLAKATFISPFARFQTARIPTSIKRTVGVSDLPTTGVLQKMGDVANTLYRGPIGYAIAATAANYGLSHHSPADNEAGHQLDVNTGMYAVPGGIKRLTPSQAEAYGERAAPLYMPAATLDPVTYTGLRATGGKAALSRLFAGVDDNGEKVRAPGALADAVRDAANVGLGTLGPFMRGVQTALTGTQPYLQRDNTFLRVAPREPDKTAELVGQVRTALGMANPAMHAFSDDASRTLPGAVSEDGKPFGGPAALAARIAEFTVPRVMSPSVGGKTNAQSVLSQMDRDYSEALIDYKRRIREAPGPVAKARIVAQARAAFVGAGYDGDAVQVALEKTEDTDRRTATDNNYRRMQRQLEKRR